MKRIAAPLRVEHIRSLGPNRFFVTKC